MRFVRMGEVLCPNLHPIPRNSVPLKDDEDVGSRVKIECGMCGKQFKGKVVRVVMQGGN